MGSPAHGTPDPAEAKPDSTFRSLGRTLVVGMEGEADRMSAGTGQLMKLDAINNRIIIRLGYLIAIPDINGNHGIVNERQAGLSQGKA